MRCIERLDGSGTVTSNAGERVNVQYRLGVYQQDIPARSQSNPLGCVPGLKEIHGSVTPVRFFGQPLTLEMEDGRKVQSSS